MKIPEIRFFNTAKITYKKTFEKLKEDINYNYNNIKIKWKLFLDKHDKSILKKGKLGLFVDDYF
jgi:hypothetical protein